MLCFCISFLMCAMRVLNVLTLRTYTLSTKVLTELLRLSDLLNKLISLFLEFNLNQG